jgi:prepilin-type N-terminal cleavage/methylation domain-containing protein
MSTSPQELSPPCSSPKTHHSTLPRRWLNFALHRRRTALPAFTLPKLRGRISAFTLVEMLVVIAIILVLMVLLAPAFTSLKTAGDTTSAAYTIGGLLEQARAYAMANNTFVWVGFKEVDISNDASVTPQTTGTGRVAVAIVASKDGSRGFDVVNPAWIANYSTGTKVVTNLVAISKLQRLENVHLATTLNGFGHQPPTTGNMARPYIISNNYVVGNAPTSLTPFDWPVGSPLDAGQYSFKKVIYFDPQGVARIQYAGNEDVIVSYMEVGLQQTRGTALSSSPNVAALQVDCMTGAIRTYRP